MRQAEEKFCKKIDIKLTLGNASAWPTAAGETPDQAAATLEGGKTTIINT